MAKPAYQPRASGLKSIFSAVLSREPQVPTVTDRKRDHPTYCVY